MRVQIADPALTADFIDFFRRADYITIDRRASLVELYSPAKVKAAVAKADFRVQLATWQALHPSVDVEQLN
jgi:hypothetical protein